MGCGNLFYQEKTAMDEVYTKLIDHIFLWFFSQVSKKLTKYLAQMQAIQEQVNSSKSVEKYLKAMKAKISDLEVMDKSLDAQLLDRQGKVEELEKLNKHLEKERDLKCETATKEYNQVSSEVEARRRDLEARRNNVEAVIAKAKDINLKIALVKEASAAEQNQLLLKCEEIVQEKEEGIDLVCEAICSSIFNDLGSGSNVDVCVITKGYKEYLTNHKLPNPRTYVSRKAYSRP